MLDRHPIVGTIVGASAGLIGGLMAAVALSPQLSEPGGTDVIFEAPQLRPIDRGLLLALAIVAGGLILWVLVPSKGSHALRRLAFEVAVVSAGFGVLAGLGFRVITARSVGANIGGGLVMMASPVVGLIFILYVALRVQGMRQPKAGHP